jgi:ABC-2 type transport system ATP-binding protein
VRELLAAASDGRVNLRSPRAAEVMTLLARAGATVTSIGPESITVIGLDAARIAELTAERGLLLHELTPQRASLEDAYIELTQDAVEFTAGGEGTRA